MVVSQSCKSAAGAAESGLKCSSCRPSKAAGVLTCSTRNLDSELYSSSKWASSNVNVTVIGFATLLCVSLLLVMIFWENTSPGFAFLAWTQLFNNHDDLQLRHSILRPYGLTNFPSSSAAAAAAAHDQDPAATSAAILNLQRQASPPNTFLTLQDSDAWYCGQFRRPEQLESPAARTSYYDYDNNNSRVSSSSSSSSSRYEYNNIYKSFSDWLQANVSDEEVMCVAHRAAMQPLAQGTPRVAFLFMVRGPIPWEPLWAEFFRGNEGRYSIYVHAAMGNHSFGNDSIFHQRQIPSKPLGRLSASMSEAQRRLLAYALLDDAVPNAWFSLLCEAAIPIRSFGFVYDYLTRSELSFVEAFFAWEWWREGWTTEAPQLPDGLMRKGEAWFSVHRRHAGLIVGDFFVFPKFREHWRLGGICVEIYLPTLLNIVDPLGIANRSTTYVNWTDPDTGSHPVMYSAANFSASLFRTIQSQTVNTDGMYAQTSRYSGWDNEESCVYNGIANSSCWLFARKFSGRPEDVNAMLAFTHTLIGPTTDH